jgi:hypothetical protein
MEKLCPVQIIEVLGIMFHLIRTPRALADEVARCFGIKQAQNRPIPHFLVLIKARIGRGDKVFPAKRLSDQR